MATRSPRPGQPTRGSRTGRPIMVLLDALGRRWALRLLWELRDRRALTFRALQEACGGVSPAVLNTRLRELTELHLVEAGDAGYHLTVIGRDLEPIILRLDAYAERWARTLT